MLIKYLALVALSVLTLSANAALVTFNDRTTWQATAGPLSDFEDFESFLVDTQFRTQAVKIIGMTVSGGTTSNGDNSNLIDVSPLVHNGFEDINGTTALVGDVDYLGVVVSFVFDTPLVSWGASFKGLSPSTIFDVLDKDYNTLGSFTSIHTIDEEFLGFQLTGGETAYSMSIRFTGGSNDFFRMDNMGIVSAVPVPAAAWLFGSALLGLVGISRKRKQQA